MGAIYITHCSAKKDDSRRNTEEKVPPSELYTATPTKRFMQRCEQEGVAWAILSDRHGVWFPNERHKWYEKAPDSVTEIEFGALIVDFEGELATYDPICFYHNPGRFHPLYRRLIRENRLADRVILFSHLSEIGTW